MEIMVGYLSRCFLLAYKEDISQFHPSGPASSPEDLHAGGRKLRKDPNNPVNPVKTESIGTA
jgi:hypothetical protein